ncbi:MAG: GNAT family N-acetyltransferase [Actinomycetes bacterium]
MIGRRRTDLDGPRVALRPLRDTDFEAWRDVRSANREWLEPWEPLPEFGTPDALADRGGFRARCQAWDRQRQFDAAYGYGIFLGAALIGEVSLGSVQRGPFQSAYVGYWMDEAHAGRGFTPEAVVLTLRYGFEHLALHRIEAAIVPRNTASRRVAEKLGMRDEGNARGLLQIRGVFEDHVRYAMLSEEWTDRKSDLEAEFLT